MSSLKLPLKIFMDGDSPTRMRVFEKDGRLVCDVRGYGDTRRECQDLARHHAEVIVAALEADAELGDPPCECCTKKGTEPYWHQECDCMNSGDLADAAGWCAGANLLERKSDEEKGEQDG